MKIVYCANCGTRLNIMRRALPKFGTIVDVVEFHECPAEPVKLDLTPVDLPTFNRVEGKNKFVQKLNELNPPPALSIVDRGLRDRRDKADVKETSSSAPMSLTEQIKSLQNTVPANDIK